MGNRAHAASLLTTLILRPWVPPKAGFQTVILPGSPSFPLSSGKMTVWKPDYERLLAAILAWFDVTRLNELFGPQIAISHPLCCVDVGARWRSGAYLGGA